MHSPDTLAESIAKHQQLEREHARSLLGNRLLVHRAGNCACSPAHGRCLAGQWDEGEISSQQVITEANLTP